MLELRFDHIAYVRPARFASDGGPFPGLYDVTLDDGREFNDLTQPQVLDLARKLNLDLRLAS